MAGMWTPLTAMAGGKRTRLGVVGFPGAATAALVQQGSLLQSAGIYAIGGFNQPTFLKRTERYDIVANAWTAMADMPTGRADFAVVAAHKWIYAIGGIGGAGASTSVERFEPQAGPVGTWTKSTGLSSGRWSLGAAAVVVTGQLRIYAIGGTTGAPSNKVEWCEITASGEGPWKAGPPLKIGREKFGIAVVNNSIFCVGGNSDVGAEDSIEELKPGANSWTLYKAALSTARSSPGTAYSGGLIFAIGGIGPAGPLKTVEAFDPATKKSSTNWATMPALRTQFGTGTIPVFVMSPKDKIPVFVVGGDDASGAKDTAYRFDEQRGIPVGRAQPHQTAIGGGARRVREFPREPTEVFAGASPLKHLAGPLLQTRHLPHSRACLFELLSRCDLSAG